MQAISASWHIQQYASKATTINARSCKVGLKINAHKAKEMRFSIENTALLYRNNTAVERVEKFPYIGCIIDSPDGTEKDVQSRITKARKAFDLLNPIWTSTANSLNTKINIFISNDKPVLQYECE